MALTQIFHFFQALSKAQKTSAKTAHATDDIAHAETDAWQQIERRQANDRRLRERRNMHCQPYMNTRKNYGRRRSLGRRAKDQTSALPF